MVIIGINEGHNATACCLVNGEVKACASEERFTGVKNDVGYPLMAIDYVLKDAGLSAKDVDKVVYGTIFQNPLPLRIKRTSRFSIKDYMRENYDYWKPLLYENRRTDFWEKLQQDPRLNSIENLHYNFDFLETTPLNELKNVFNEERKKVVQRHLGIDVSKVDFVEHHICHAYYAYFASPIDKSKKTAIVTADSWGEDCNATISIGQGSDIKEVFRTDMCNMARIYRWMTLLLNMKPDEHEYKVMGLAPYAKSYLRKPAYEIFAETLEVDGIDFRWKNKPSDMFFYFKDRFERECVRFDGIAGGLQDWLEELLQKWFTNILEKYKVDQVVYSGGLSMNVKANKIIGEIPKIKDFFIPPSGGDESNAIGAAYYANTDTKELKPLSNAYLGEAINEKEVTLAIKEYSNKLDFDVIESPGNDQIAKLLEEGKVIARVVGRMEFGARSLGNRSILCNPSHVDYIRKINEKIKFRDFWMPFTPSILQEREQDYIINPKRFKTPYMTLAFDSTDLAKHHLAAAIHPYDATVRVQLINREINPSYYDLIKAFEKRTGIGAILNTSLNLHGKPIVRTPMDAMYTFQHSGLDAVLFPNVLLIKK